MEPVCLVPISNLNVEFRQPFSFEGLKERFTLCTKSLNTEVRMYICNLRTFQCDHLVRKTAFTLRGNTAHPLLIPDLLSMPDQAKPGWWGDRSSLTFHTGPSWEKG